MTAFFSRYRLVESIAATVLCLMIGAGCYIGFLHTVIRQCEITQHTVDRLTLSLRTQQQAIEHEKLVALQLQHWKIKHTDFYHAVQTFSSSDALSKALCVLLQQTGFNILAIKPITTTTQSASSPIMQVEFTIQGSFQSLLSLFTALNQFSYPVTITELTIHRVSIFHIQLAWQI